MTPSTIVPTSFDLLYSLYSCMYVSMNVCAYLLCVYDFLYFIQRYESRIIRYISMINVFCYRFRIDNTDHIIDVNKNNAAFEYDQVNIICPVYQPGTYDEDAEKYIIYNVSTFVSNRNAKNLALDIGRKIVTSPSVYPGLAIHSGINR